MSTLFLVSDLKPSIRTCILCIPLCISLCLYSDVCICSLFFLIMSVLIIEVQPSFRGSLSIYKNDNTHFKKHSLCFPASVSSQFTVVP